MWKKRVKRSRRKTVEMLVGHNTISILVMASISGIGAVIGLYIGEVLQVPELTKYGLVGISVPTIVLLSMLLLFLRHLIRRPSPRRWDANFVINYEYPQIISAKGLPVKNRMQWVQANTYFQINYPTEIKTLELLLKGKRWKAHEWEPIMSDKMLTPRYHFFQIPTGVDLTKHKAELVASTNDEDYGSGKFDIKQ